MCGNSDVLNSYFNRDNILGRIEFVNSNENTNSDVNPYERNLFTRNVEEGTFLVGKS